MPEKEFVKDPDLLPLEHIIKFESEGFADSVVVQKTGDTIDCKLDVGPKALDHSMKPVVALKFLDEATISFWTKWKTADSSQPKRVRKILKKPVSPSKLETCDVCGVRKGKDALRAHMKVHNSRKECPRCHNFKSSLVSHLKFCQKEVGCVECGEICKGKKALRFHKLTVHSKEPSYFCHCGEVFKKPKRLWRHKKESHSNIRQPCTHCSQTFTSRSSMLQHFRKIHEEKYGPFNQASKQFKPFDPALDHKGPYFCDFCGKEFGTRRTVYQHMKFQHVVKPFIFCDLCPLSFRQKFAIERHIMWHHLKIQALKCKVCDFKTSSKGTMKRHEMTHQKKTKCSQCDRLVANMRYHLLGCQKTRTCPICNKSVTKNDFARHKKMHIKKQIDEIYKEMD